MNPPESTSTTSADNKVDKYVFLLIKGITDPEILEDNKQELKNKGLLKVDQFILASSETIDQKAFKYLLQRAINTAKQLNANLVLSHFKPFEKDISLPAMHILANSGIDFVVQDFPSLNKANFKILVEVYERRKKTGRKESNSEARVNNASNNLNNLAQKPLNKRRKLQNVYWDVNNQITLVELISLRSEINNFSDTALASHLTHKNILTPRGKFHTQKSVSRIKPRLNDLRIWFRHNFKQLDKINNQFDVQTTSIRASAQVSKDNKIKTKIYELPVNSLLDSELLKNKKKKLEIQFINEESGGIQVETPSSFNEKIGLDFSGVSERGLLTKIFIISSLNETEFAFTWEGELPDELVLPIKDTYLLPGIHYLEIEVDGYEKEIIEISIMDFLNPLKVEKELDWKEKFNSAIQS